MLISWNKMRKIIQLYKKINGREVLIQYLYAHVLGFALCTIILFGLSKKSLEIVRLAVSNRILCRLRKKYHSFVLNFKSKNALYMHEHKKTDNMWVCWLQGIEEAPFLVQKCYQSIKDNLSERNVILLDNKNYKEYVEFPDSIQRKIDSGIISKTHMSDLLRLELLTRYGGTWIDATVYISGKNIPVYMLDSDLFLFQDLKPGLDGHCTRISNWFITASTHNPILELTKSLLYDYWEKNSKLVDYFLFHDFLEIAIETYPEEWEKVIPYSNSIPHILLLRLFEKYNDDVWTALKNLCCVHKLSYKFEEVNQEVKDTFYDKLFN